LSSYSPLKAVQVVGCVHLIGKDWAEKPAVSGFTTISRPMWTHSQGFCFG
jgi:hypothetical protein